jgi:hypothetical protein
VTAVELDYQEEDGPIDLAKLRVMAQKFPKDYTQRLESLLLYRDQSFCFLRQQLNELTSQNAVLAESQETQKFVVQSLAAALAKARKNEDELPEIEVNEDILLRGF